MDHGAFNVEVQIRVQLRVIAGGDVVSVVRRCSASRIDMLCERLAQMVLVGHQRLMHIGFRLSWDRKSNCLHTRTHTQATTANVYSAINEEQEAVVFERWMSVLSHVCFVATIDNMVDELERMTTNLLDCVCFEIALSQPHNHSDSSMCVKVKDG